MKKLLVTAAVIWVSGFVAALVLVGRWRHIGNTQPPPGVEPVAADPSDAATAVQRTAHRLTDPIVAGAKHDLHIVRDATRKVTHRHEAAVDEMAAAASAN
jgi:hypothetical protein